MRSEFAVPFNVGERVVGVLAVCSQRSYAFAADDQIMLVTVGDKVAVAIEKVRLFEETSQRARSLGVLYETALVTSGVLDSDSLLEKLSEQVD